MASTTGAALMPAWLRMSTISRNPVLCRTDTTLLVITSRTFRRLITHLLRAHFDAITAIKGA